jgi:hypothetical protein
MAEPLVPQLHRRLRGSGEGLVRQLQGVKITRALTSELHRLRWKILDGEASGVKFNGNVIVTGKLFDRNQILDQGRRNKNIIQVERRGRCRNLGMSCVSNRQLVAVSNSDERGERKGARGGNYTRGGGHVRRGASVKVPFRGTWWSGDAGRLKGGVERSVVPGAGV